MRHIRKTGLALMAGILLLTGCGSGKEDSVKSIKIGVTLYDQYDTFISELMQTFKSTTLKMESEKGVAISLEILDASGNQTTQNEQVRTLMEKGCDVICVNLVDRTEPTTITDMAEKNNIPIIFFNRELVAEDLERWSKLYYVGADAFDSGRLEGALAADAFLTDATMDKNQDGICQYVVLEGEAGHQDAISRTDSSVKTLIEQGINLEKLSYLFADWNRGQAENRMNQIISQYGTEVEMVISNNDEMALGAIEAYKDAGYNRQEWPIIFGIDGLEDALEAIQNGTMQGTVYNDKEDQAEEMARLAVDIYDGKNQEVQSLQEEKYYVSQYRKVDISNVEDFIK